MEKLEVEFVSATSADATRFAEDLANFVKANVDGVEADVARGSPDTMDFGATVAILLGTPAIVALAHGLADWIKRQGDPELVIKTSKGSITVKSGLDLEAKKEIILAALEKAAL